MDQEVVSFQKKKPALFTNINSLKLLFSFLLLIYYFWQLFYLKVKSVVSLDFQIIILDILIGWSRNKRAVFCIWLWAFVTKITSWKVEASAFNTDPVIIWAFDRICLVNRVVVNQAFLADNRNFFQLWCFKSLIFCFKNYVSHSDASNQFN